MNLLVKSSNDLKINLGKPDEDFKNEEGNTIFVYKTKNMEFHVKEILK